MAQKTTFSALTIELIWQKGKTDLKYDGRIYRQDSYGRWMKRDEYGQCTQFGWEVDHIMPVSRGGSDALSNLQPLHWENNRRKSDRLF